MGWSRLSAFSDGSCAIQGMGGASRMRYRHPARSALTELQATVCERAQRALHPRVVMRKMSAAPHAGQAASMARATQQCQEVV